MSRAEPRRRQNGYSNLRHCAFAPRTGGELYRRRLAGADHRGASAGTGARRRGAIRARRAHRLAHAHPLGQTLFVIAGAGRVQSWGGKVREIRAGDVVWIPPNEKHWHGAAPDTNMVHVAMQEALDGKHVTWMEHVTDEQYRAAAAG